MVFVGVNVSGFVVVFIGVITVAVTTTLTLWNLRVNSRLKR